MDLNISQILNYSVIPTLITSLLTLYLNETIKAKIKSNFDSKIEKLKNEYSIELSQFQAEISALKAKENFKFTKLHEKRLEIIEITYKLINEVLIELNQYVIPLKAIPNGKTFLDNDNDLQNSFLKKHWEFTNHYTNNRFYYDLETKKLIDDYLSNVREAYDSYNEKHMLTQMGERPDREMNKKASQAFKNIEIKINPIKLNIEEKFAEILEK